MSVTIEIDVRIPDLPKAFREVEQELGELLAAEAELIITDQSSTRWPHPGFPGATHSTGFSIEAFRGVPQGDYAELVNTVDYSGYLESGRWPPDARYERAAERTLEEGIPEFVKTLEAAIRRLLPKALRKYTVDG